MLQDGASGPPSPVAVASALAHASWWHCNTHRCCALRLWQAGRATPWTGLGKPARRRLCKAGDLCVLHSQSLRTLLLLHTVFVPIVLQTLKRSRPASNMADGLRAWGNKACTDAPCVVAACSGLLASGRACGQCQSMIVTISPLAMQGYFTSSCL